MKAGRVIDTLPDLPPEVLEIIWEFVRIDLRPRMKRYGPLLRNIRNSAGTRIAAMHGRWLHQAYTFTHTQGVSPEWMVLCAWKFLGLHCMRLKSKTMQSDDEHHHVALVTMEQDEPAEYKIPRLIESRAFALWKRMPAPDLHRCHAGCPTHFAFGPPTPIV